MSFDQIADMLTRIRNAQKAGKVDVSMPSSKLKLALAKILHQRGYISEISIYSEGNKQFLRLRLKYANSNPAIKGIQRVSKQGQRIYVGKDRIPTVKNGFGIAIISTSKGVVTNEDAKKLGVGGEVICEVW